MWWARITCHCQAVVNYWGNFIFIFSNWSAWLCCNCLRLGFVYNSLFSQKIFGWSFLFSVFLPLFNHFCHEQLTLKMQCFCKDFFYYLSLFLHFSLMHYHHHLHTEFEAGITWCKKWQWGMAFHMHDTKWLQFEFTLFVHGF